jgi:hypothetical protein
MVYLGKPTATYENNCRELIKIVDDFLSQPNESTDRLTKNFVNGNLFLKTKRIKFDF